MRLTIPGNDTVQYVENGPGLGLVTVCATLNPSLLAAAEVKAFCGWATQYPFTKDQIPEVGRIATTAGVTLAGTTLQLQFLHRNNQHWWLTWQNATILYVNQETI